MALTNEILSVFLSIDTCSTATQQGSNFINLLPTIGIVIAICAGVYTILYGIYRSISYIEKHIGRIKDLEVDAKEHIKPSIKDLVNRVEDHLLPKIDEISLGVAYLRGAWERSLLKDVTVSRSPRQLNQSGMKILQASGIDSIMDEQFKIILEKVVEKKPSNAYQVQEVIVDVVQRLKDDPKLTFDIEMGAFRAGTDIEIVLIVGAYYIRDKILAQLNMDPSEIDANDPVKKQPDPQE
jgi:hypothetical protein